ncbi:hypothetical protein PanWU01x14_238650 [Parasponia andersonii]|uniref:TRF2/HOY1 PH-like domain-containing protein n=1 Tax=Parasponia andersonii TaxID=3476 RepID=A0A2P5BHE3_PARAD|nr:hypothetical protein PanWU01x14_238650 [Parasponia andersonii]
MDASSNNRGLPSASETNSVSEESDSNTQVASNNDNGGLPSEESGSNTQVLSNQSLLQTPIRNKEQLEHLDHLHETGQNLDGFCSTDDIEIHGLEGHEGNELPDDDFDSDIGGLAEDMSEYSRAFASQASYVGGIVSSASEELGIITSNKQGGEIEKHETGEKGHEGKLYNQQTVLDASVITIGSWQRVALDSRNLIAFFFYDEQILAWEILERGLKFKLKIEIKWEHIVGMRVSLEKNEPGILEVEISQPPLFFEDRDPHPTKPADWTSIPDFTDAEATFLRSVTGSHA